MRLLLSKGVDVEPMNYRGTPLHLSANKDREEVVKILLEHGADVCCPYSSLLLSSVLILSIIIKLLFFFTLEM